MNFVRYADDFITTGCSKELLASEVKPLVECYMADQGLQLSPEKTCITHIEDGFDFLGQNLRKYGGKLLITPSKRTCMLFWRSAKTMIMQNIDVIEKSLWNAVCQRPRPCPYVLRITRTALQFHAIP